MVFRSQEQEKNPKRDRQPPFDAKLTLLHRRQWQERMSQEPSG